MYKTSKEKVDVNILSALFLAPFQATAEANNLAALASSKDSYTKKMEHVSYLYSFDFVVTFGSRFRSPVTACTVVLLKCSETLALLELLYNPRVNKEFESFPYLHPH